MKYIYLKKEEALKGISLVVAVLDEQNKNYKEEYGEDIIEFIGEDLPHFITYDEETDTVRKATEEEKSARNQLTLKENEIIIDGVVYAYDKQYQKIENGKIVNKSNKELVEEGVLSLVEFSKIQRERLKKIRDELLHKPLKMSLKPYKQNEKIEILFQVEDKDLAKFGRIKGTLFTLSKLGISKNDVENSKTILSTMGIDEETIEIIITFLKTGALPWVLADNTTQIFEFEKLEMVEVAFGIREQQIFAKFIELDKKLATANTIEEIEAIKWGDEYV